jgi:hypothetical protein
MAGLGFDQQIETVDPKLAAQNVECIHTSYDAGTSERRCHQNWNMGCCGWLVVNLILIKIYPQNLTHFRRYQLGEETYPRGSHGLCNYFFNVAFEKQFLAVPNLYGCYEVNPVKTWPDGFQMGYMEDFEKKR